VVQRFFRQGFGSSSDLSGFLCSLCRGVELGDVEQQMSVWSLNPHLLAARHRGYLTARGARLDRTALATDLFLEG